MAASSGPNNNRMGSTDFRMPPTRTSSITALAHNALAVLQPEVLKSPRPVDLLPLIERVLPKHKIRIYPASTEELDDCWGSTDTTGTDKINVLIDARLFEALYTGDRRHYHLARGTVAHELGHCVMHVEIMRRRRERGSRLMHRMNTNEFKIYEGSEWQAWAFAGAFLAPPGTIRLLETKTIEAAASLYETSTELMRRHLARQKIDMPER